MENTYKLYLTKSDWVKLLKAHPELKTPMSEQQPQLMAEIESEVAAATTPPAGTGGAGVEK